MKKITGALWISLVVLFISSPTFVQAHGEHQHGIEEEEEVEATEEKDLVEVGNKICPVSGEEIKKEEAFKYEYEGKIYNLCCKMCLKDFKKDPEKYIEKLEAMEAEKEGYK